MGIPPLALRWGALIALSLALGFALNAIHLPGALLIGPMVASIVFATRGHAVRVPQAAFVCGQGVVGVMIAGFLPLSIGAEMAARWPVFVLGTLSTLIAASALGWLMARSRLLPGTTAIWGSSPGAATVMTLMSEHYGADLRLVALMQYLRVVCCAAVAALMARIIGEPATSHAAAAAAPALAWGAVAATLVVAWGGAWLGVRTRLPGAPLVLPMALGIAAKAAALLTVSLPTPLLALCYAVIGWGLGARFTPDIIGHAARVLPRVFLGIMALIALCGCFAVLLVKFAGIDPLTAYLATSPGGADTVVIIAATTKVDTPFVIAMQMARFFCVMITGPAVARMLSPPRGAAPAESLSRP